MKTRVRTTAVAALLIALVAVYSIVSKEEQSTPTDAVQNASAIAHAGSPSVEVPAAGASLELQALPPRQAGAGSTVQSPSRETFTPVATSVAPANPPALNRAETTHSAAAPERAPAVAQPSQQAAEEIPLHWFITGSNVEGYELRIDRALVLSGSASAVLESLADTDTSRFGALAQVASAASLKGKRIELSGYIATREAPAGASIWMRADDASGTPVAFENTSVRGIRGTQEWTYQNIVIDIPKEANGLMYGAILMGGGKLYVDDLQFRVVDASVPVTAKPIVPPRNPARGTLPAPSQEPRNLDFEQTQVKTQ